MANKAAAKAAKRQVNQASPIEALRSIGDGLGKTAQNETRAALGDVWKQLISLELGGGQSAKAPEAQAENQDPTKGPVEIFHAGKLTPAEIAEKRIGAKKLEKSAGSHSEAAIHYDMKHVVERGLKRESQEKLSEIDQIKSEIAKLTKASSTESQTKFAVHTLNHAPKRVGNYDVVFFTGLLKSAQISKEKVADSGSWLSASKGKNAKKGDFSVANGKMHQSGERTTVQNAAG